ncbi:glycosyltransferase family 2 protein [Cytobacillus firmus]|uniref:glycosyltransferase family 2 protein n=1 Tax=Cytobacillus firmus TaxID=1399 RepID=UPI00300354C8
MNIIIPMAGKGNRFVQAGYKKPKMLVTIKGRPMFYWALKGLRDHFKLSNFTFVCLEEHLQTTNLEEEIRKFAPGSKIVTVHEYTQGQAETVLKAALKLDQNKELLVFNCDTFFKCTKFSINNNLDGQITVFKSNNPGLSYVKVNKSELVVKIAEKEIISNLATIGLYYFKSTNLYIDACNQIIQNNIKSHGEYYISKIYEVLIKKGMKIGINLADECYPLGTPIEKEIFEENFKEEVNE